MRVLPFIMEKEELFFSLHDVLPNRVSFISGLLPQDKKGQKQKYMSVALLQNWLIRGVI